MSGVNRNIVSDIAEKGLTGAEAMAYMSPENIRNEKGNASEERSEGENYKGGQAVK